MYHQCRKVKSDLPERYDQAVQQGLFKWARPGKPGIALESFRQDPGANPLPTESGKIEIFSKRLWDISREWELPEGDRITALPEFHATWGMPEDPLAERYPLQLIGHHYKQRTHSSYGNNDWLEEAAVQHLWINPVDAEARGIHHGDTVRVYNGYGETVVPAKLTPRIIPGVTSLPQGAWHKPGQDGMDRNGCINVLTRHRPSPLAKGNPQHTNLVQVEKYEARPHAR
jgi:anaerobic selenocysteine-containing dehydrogenase